MQKWKDLPVSSDQIITILGWKIEIWGSEHAGKLLEENEPRESFNMNITW